MKPSQVRLLMIYFFCIRLTWLWNRVRFDIRYECTYLGMLRCEMRHASKHGCFSFHSKLHLRNRVWLAYALGIVFCHKFRFKYVHVWVRVYGKHKVCPGRDIRASTFFFLLPVSFLRVTQVLCCFCWLIIVLTLWIVWHRIDPLGNRGNQRDMTECNCHILLIEIFVY